MRKPKTSVLLLESDEILRAGAVSVLEADGRFSVGRARNAAEARLEWSLRPSVLVLPVDRPSVLVLPVDREAFDPYAWLAAARERAGVKVLLALEPDVNPAFVRSLLQRGACGYVERTSDVAGLPEMLEHILREGHLEEGETVRRALAEYEALRAKHASLLSLFEGLSDTAYASLVGPLAGDSDAETADRLSRVVRSVRDARSEAKKALLRAGFTRESVIAAIEELRLAEKTAGRLPALR